MDPELAKAARIKEMTEFKEKRVYVECDITECWDKTGAPPISTRWVDINKGDEANPEYRSRWVARDFGKIKD